MAEFSEIKFTGIHEKMKGVHLVLAIYEVRDIQEENGKIFTDIILNETILDMIDEINFTYVKNGLEPSKVIKKVGFLNNLQVHLDPIRETNCITFTNENKEIYELNVIF
jgi:hypothetical protein